MAQGMGSSPGEPGVGREAHTGADGSGRSSGHLGDQVQHQAGKMADQAQHQVGKATEQVQHQASKVLEQARGQGVSWATSQKDQVCEGMGSMARVLRQSRQQLEQDDQQMLASAFGMAADQVEHFSRVVRERDVEQLMGEVERTARRQPAIFLGSAFVLGLIAARFLKSSAPEVEPDYGAGYDAGYGSAYSGGYGASQRYGGGYGAEYGSTSSRSGEIRPEPATRPTTGASGTQMPYRGTGSSDVRQG